MKILLITRKYPPSVGGMQLFARDLYEALLPKADIKLVKWAGPNWTLPIALAHIVLKSTWELAKGGVDVIHSQDGLLAPLGYGLAKVFRKPFCVVIHGLDITYHNRLYKTVVPWAVQRADAVFCISQAAADECVQRGVKKSKIQVVPLAVQDKLYGKSDRAELVKRLQLPTDSQLLLTVGRLVKRKGVAWFIENVLPNLVKEYPKLVYLVAGDGSGRTSIESAIEHNHMGNHVRLLGRVDDSLYKEVYNGADIFVMPNINVLGDIEGFGLVLLEAALCELPVVAANTEGIKDAIQDGNNGVLVPPKDTLAFHKQIKRFLDDKAITRQFGRQSRRFTLDNYQWSKLADRYMEQYRRISR